MATQTTERISELILESELLTPGELDEARKLHREHGGNLCNVLVAHGYLSESELLTWLANLPGMTSIDIAHYAIDPALRDYVTAPFAAAHEVMPLDKLKTNLTVAMAVPLDADTTTELHEMTDLTIRPVLCSMTDIHAAIEQYYTSEDAPNPWPWNVDVSPEFLQPSLPTGGAPAPGPEAVRLAGVVAILNAVDRFPLLPDVHTRILERMGDPDVAAADLAEVIERDATLTANVLKLANSAAFAARNSFNGVQRAVAYLGLRELRGLILSSAVVQCLTEEAQCDLRELLDASYRRGMLTKIIVAAGGVDDRDIAFTTGLLADLGDIALRIFCSERLDEIEAAPAWPGRAVMEETVFGMTASEVGFHLAQRWNIPDPIAEAIRYHDRLELSPSLSSITLSVALAKHCLAQDAVDGTFGDPAANPSLGRLLERLDLTPEALRDIGAQYREAQFALTDGDWPPGPTARPISSAAEHGEHSDSRTSYGNPKS